MVLKTRSVERSREPARALTKVVLSNPSGIKTYSFRMPDLLRRRTISLHWSRVIQKPREKPNQFELTNHHFIRPSGQK